MRHFLYGIHKGLVSLVVTLFLFAFCKQAVAQYNSLYIPDTLSGTIFTLNLVDTFKQMLPGQQTITNAINGDFWGPTMFWRKGDTVRMNVNNRLRDSTTLHWHGMHLPAVMDGGPHQIVPPSTVWNPYWKVANKAATYWYHPHLHMTTEKQLNMGMGGFIIIRDNEEAALNLPRSYGVDDFPLALSDRRFDTQNQIVSSHYGDTVVINGTINPILNVPAQVIRFRILGAAVERSYNIGFSDNRQFYVIASDAGLLNAPVPLTRYALSAGERIEILVNCNGQQGAVVDLMAYNQQLQRDMPGNEPNIPQVPDYIRNRLGGRNFNLLHLNIKCCYI
ncbi:MAG: multicopper oxidase domain-containing protein, partial [Bacteroidia bacterium]|nr:multicopper oxidase domain-containing protein [Bacteroidia bacterium]